MPDTLTLAHSPDADDLVMWWPLTGMKTPEGDPVEGPLGTPRVDTGGFEFQLVPEDVEKLNQVVAGGSGADAYDLTNDNTAVDWGTNDGDDVSRTLYDVNISGIVEKMTVWNDVSSDQATRYM